MSATVSRGLQGPQGPSAFAFDVTNPEYAAAGDGAADDTTAIQAAISDAAAASATVYIPEGTFRIGTLTLPSNLRIKLDGTLKRRNAATGALLTASAAVSNITIDGGTIDNNASTESILTLPTNGTTDIQVRGVTFTNYTSASPQAISIGSSGDTLNERIRVEGCYFDGDSTANNGLAVSVVNGADVWVVNNNFVGAGARNETSQSLTTTARGTFFIGNRFQSMIASAMLVRPQGSTTIEDVVISGNSGTDIGNDPSHTTDKGLLVVGESTTGTAGTNMIRRVRVTGNSLRYFGGNAIAVGGGTAQGRAEDVTIADNTIDAADFSGNFDNTWSGSNMGINVQNTDGFSIAGNRIRRVGRGGIRLSGNSGSGRVTKNGTVTGNSLDLCAIKTDATSPAIDQECGIVVFADAKDIVISGNLVKNTGAVGGATNQAGIGTLGSSTISGIVITGNRCFDDRGTKLTPYGVRISYPGTSDADGPTQCTVHGNDLSGNLTGGLLVTGTITTDKDHSTFANRGAGSNTSNRVLSAAASYDPPSIAAGASTTTTVSALGAAVGDPAVASFTGTLNGIQTRAEVTATHTVTVTFTNPTGGAIDLAPATVRVLVFKQQA